MTNDNHDGAPAGPPARPRVERAGAEFEDEEPGAYLRELNLAPGLIVWSAINLLAAPGVLAAVVALDPRGVEVTPWRLIWHLAPVSSALLGVTTLWYASSRMTRRSPRSVAFALTSCVLCFAAYIYGMRFAPAHPIFAPPGAL